MTTETTKTATETAIAPNYGRLCDTRTGEIIRAATRDELLASLAEGDSGAIEIDGRSVYVDRSHDDLESLGIETATYVEE